MNTIAQAIRNNNLVEYQRIRYPRIQDGEEICFVDEDFSRVDFDAFSMGFFKFDHCRLDKASHIYGQPIYLSNSSVHSADFRGAKVILYAENCDFTDIKFDHETLFAYDKDTASEFINCTFDDEARSFFTSQGVKFVDNR